MNTKPLRNGQQVWRHSGVFSESLRTLGATLVVPLAALLPTVIPAQDAIEAWVQRFQRQGDAGPPKMLLDAGGNVLLTGYSYDAAYEASNDDWVTLKYSSAGVPIWTNYYNGPGSSLDRPHALAVDASGNVFVTGGSFGSPGAPGCVVVK